MMNGDSGGMPLHNNTMPSTDDLGASPLPMSFPMGGHGHGGYNMSGENGSHHMDTMTSMEQGGIAMGGSMGGYQGVDMSGHHHTMGTSSSSQVGGTSLISIVSWLLCWFFTSKLS